MLYPCIHYFWTGRVWLNVLFKTAISATAARDFIALVFHNICLPDTLVSNCNL